MGQFFTVLFMLAVGVFVFKYAGRLLRWMAIFVVGVFVYMCATDKDLIPPVEVTFRDSLITGKVLQVRNTSAGETLNCNLRVSNKEKMQRGSYTFRVSPGSMHEIGLMEMGWSFEPGETYTIDVERYVIPVHATVPK